MIFRFIVCQSLMKVKLTSVQLGHLIFHTASSSVVQDPIS